MFTETFRLLLVKALSALLGFTVTLTITQSLDVDSSGIYFLILSIVAVIIPVCLAGLGSYLIKYDGDIKLLNSFSILFVFISSVVISVLMCVLQYFFEILNGLEITISMGILISSVILANCIGEYLGNIYQKESKAWIGGAFIILIRQLLTLLLLFGFTLNNIRLDIEAAFSILLFSSLISIVISFLYIKDSFSFSNVSLERGLAFLKKSKVFMANHILATINGGLIPILLATFGTLSDVAYFSIPLKVVALTSLILIPLNRVVAPRYSQCFNDKDFVGLQSVCLFSARLCFLFSVPLILIMYFTSEVILGLFGPEYLKSSMMVFKVMLVGQLINSMTGSVGWLLQMTGSELAYRNLSIINLLITVISSYFLIQLYGALGAAIAYSFSLAFVNVVSVLLIKKRVGLNVLKFF
jgi:O-antigen/teichoic acid export membrane protein